MQFFAGFEADGFAGCNADLGAGAGIATDAGFAGTDAEDAKAAQFDTITGSERLFEALEDGVHGSLSLGPGEARAVYYVMDDVLFNQRGYLAGPFGITLLRPTLVMLQVLERLWNSEVAEKSQCPSFFAWNGLLPWILKSTHSNGMPHRVPNFETVQAIP
jgi:hypothetical protein